jgi:hypothetical protein
MTEPLDRVAIEALKAVVSATIDALEEAEGFPLPWAVQRVVREQVTRAFEMGRTTKLTKPSVPMRPTVPSPPAPSVIEQAVRAAIVETYSDEARPTNPAPPKDASQTSGTRYRKFAAPKETHKKRADGDD